MSDDPKLDAARDKAAKNILNKLNAGGVPTESEWDILVEARQRQSDREPVGEPLANTKHELFSQGIADGKSNGDAYTSAGYKTRGASASVNGCKLLKNPKVKKRVSDLVSASASRVVMTKQQALLRLTNLAKQDKRAIQAIQEIARLLDWYPDKKIELESGGQGVLQLSFVPATPEMLEELKDDN